MNSFFKPTLTPALTATQQNRLTEATNAIEKAAKAVRSFKTTIVDVREAQKRALNLFAISMTSPNPPTNPIPILDRLNTVHGPRFRTAFNIFVGRNVPSAQEFQELINARRTALPDIIAIERAIAILPSAESLPALSTSGDTSRVPLTTAQNTTRATASALVFDAASKAKLVFDFKDHPSVSSNVRKWAAFGMLGTPTNDQVPDVLNELVNTVAYNPFDSSTYNLSHNDFVVYRPKESNALRFDDSKGVQLDLKGLSVALIRSINRDAVNASYTAWKQSVANSASYVNALNQVIGRINTALDTAASRKDALGPRVAEGKTLVDRAMQLRAAAQAAVSVSDAAAEASRVASKRLNDLVASTNAILASPSASFRTFASSSNNNFDALDQLFTVSNSSTATAESSSQLIAEARTVATATLTQARLAEEAENRARADYETARIAATNWLNDFETALTAACEVARAAVNPATCRVLLTNPSVAVYDTRDVVATTTLTGTLVNQIPQNGCFWAVLADDTALPALRTLNPPATRVNATAQLLDLQVARPLVNVFAANPRTSTMNSTFTSLDSSFQPLTADPTSPSNLVTAIRRYLTTDALGTNLDDLNEQGTYVSSVGDAAQVTLATVSAEVAARQALEAVRAARQQLLAELATLRQQPTPLSTSTQKRIAQLAYLLRGDVLSALAGSTQQMATRFALASDYAAAVNRVGWPAALQQQVGPTDTEIASTPAGQEFVAQLSSARQRMDAVLRVAQPIAVELAQIKSAMDAYLVKEAETVASVNKSLTILAQQCGELLSISNRATQSVVSQSASSPAGTAGDAIQLIGRDAQAQHQKLRAEVVAMIASIASVQLDNRMCATTTITTTGEENLSITALCASVGSIMNMLRACEQKYDVFVRLLLNTDKTNSGMCASVWARVIEEQQVRDDSSAPEAMVHVCRAASTMSAPPLPVPDEFYEPYLMALTDALVSIGQERASVLGQQQQQQRLNVTYEGLLPLVGITMSPEARVSMLFEAFARKSLTLVGQMQQQAPAIRQSVQQALGDAQRKVQEADASMGTVLQTVIPLLVTRAERSKQIADGRLVLQQECMAFNSSFVGVVGGAAGLAHLVNWFVQAVDTNVANGVVPQTTEAVTAVIETLQKIKQKTLDAPTIPLSSGDQQLASNAVAKIQSLTANCIKVIADIQTPQSAPRRELQSIQGTLSGLGSGEVPRIVQIGNWLVQRIAEEQTAATSVASVIQTQISTTVSASEAVAWQVAQARWSRREELNDVATGNKLPDAVAQFVDNSSTKRMTEAMQTISDLQQRHAQAYDLIDRFSVFANGYYAELTNIAKDVAAEIAAWRPAVTPPSSSSSTTQAPPPPPPPATEQPLPVGTSNNNNVLLPTPPPLTFPAAPVQAPPGSTTTTTTTSVPVDDASGSKKPMNSGQIAAVVVGSVVVVGFLVLVYRKFANKRR